MPQVHIIKYSSILGILLLPNARHTVLDHHSTYSYSGIRSIERNLSRCENVVISTLWTFSPLSGTREAAFVHSISSASVAYAVTRSCTEGKLGDQCGCDQTYKGDSKRGWEWAGCSEDIDYGIWFSEKFVDARERGRKVDPSRVLMNIHNNRAGRLVGIHRGGNFCTWRLIWIEFVDSPFWSEFLCELFSPSSS